ncbi:MAG: nicotinamide riboside transporter PnuC [Kiritimatiellia bacterium]|nr:nicotinamide riboside transporter PnuC [Kiritimatiellia bacterium]
MSEVWSLLTSIEWKFLLGSTPMEIAATLCAVAGVFLIARQNLLGWPLGIVWAGISAWLAFTQWSLVSDGILYLTYIPIQIYCWIVWVRRGGAGEEAPFVPTWMPRKKQALLAGAALVSIAVWAVCISGLAVRISWIPEPSFLWADSATTVLNFYAQFLQARKRMENWIGWLLVNLMGIPIYWLKESPIYSVQYLFFLGLGLYGWVQWNKALKTSRSGPPSRLSA